MRSLYWFRADLRLADNLALAEAMQISDFLIAVFILTPNTWKAHNAAPCKIRFLLENLKSLSEALWKQGIPLLIRKGPSFSDCPKVLDKLCHQYDINGIHFNHEYPLDERERDEVVTKKLAGYVVVRTYHEQLVLPPGAVLSKQKTPFQIFTPFKKAWLTRAHEQQAWRAYSQSKKKFKLGIDPDPIPSRLQGFTGQKIDLYWQAGEKAAQKKLKEFCQDKIHDYQKNRDYPNIDGTSELSPYLAQGIISVRQCIVAAFEVCDMLDIESMKRNEGVATWVSELIWREFYNHIIYFYSDICRYKPFRLKTDNFPWRYDDDLLEAWKNGLTGFPIVDAGMRQLLQTGWMHNRLRMVVAMFLSKILLLDWRLGEKHFMEHLIDGDFAANNGGWQWCASTGTDAAPYFRIFNPTTQSQRFDPQGHFIRRFCPELSHLDSKTIHDPFANGIKLDELDYPQPIVDYKAMRKNTIELFKRL